MLDCYDHCFATLRCGSIDVTLCTDLIIYSYLLRFLLGVSNRRELARRMLWKRWPVSNYTYINWKHWQRMFNVIVWSDVACNTDEPVTWQIICCLVSAHSHWRFTWWPTKIGHSTHRPAYGTIVIVPKWQHNSADMHKITPCVNGESAGSSSFMILENDSVSNGLLWFFMD